MAETKSKHRIEITADDKASAVFSNIQNTLGRLGIFIGGATVAGAFVKATQAAIQFEQGLAKTATLLPPSSRNMEQFARGLERIRLSGAGGSLNELTEGLYQTVSAGVKAGDAVQFLDIAARAAKAGFTDTATAVDGLTTVLNSYRMATSEAGKVADILFTTQNLGKTTFGEMAQTLGVLLPIAASAGAKFEDIAAAIATLTIQGVPTAIAITGLRSTIAAFIEKGDAGKIATLGFAGALKDLAEQTGGDQKKMQDYLGRVEALNTVMALTGQNTDAFNSSLAAMQTAAGTADDAFNTFTNTTAGRIEKLQGLFEVFMTRIGEKFATGILSDANMDEVNKDADNLTKAFEFVAERVAASLTIWANNLVGIFKLAREVWESWKATVANDPLFNANSPYAAGGAFFGGNSGTNTRTPWARGTTVVEEQGSMWRGQGLDIPAMLQDWLKKSTDEFNAKFGYSAEELKKAADAAKELADKLAQARMAIESWGPSILGSRFGEGRAIIGGLGAAGRGGIGMRAGRGGGRLSGGLFDTQFNESTVPEREGFDIDKANEALEQFQQRVQAVTSMVLSVTSSFTQAIVQGIERGTLKIKDLFNALKSAILQLFADIAAKALASGILSILFPSIGFGAFFKGFTGFGGGGGGGGAMSYRPAPVGANPGVNSFGSGGTNNYYYIQGSLVTREQIAQEIIRIGTTAAQRGQNSLSLRS